MIRMIAAVRTAVTSLALLIGAPLVLTAATGSPLPDRMPSPTQVHAWLQNPLHPAYAAATARTLAWLVWATLTATILAVLATEIRRLRWSRLARYLPPPLQGLTATLLGAAAVTTAAPAVSAHAASPAPAVDLDPDAIPTVRTYRLVGSPTRSAPAVTQATVTPSLPHTTPGSGSTPSAAKAGAATGAAARLTYQTRHGDWLWHVAGRFVGDPLRYPEIAKLNAGLTEKYGRAFPDHIEPGDLLTLPADAHDRGPRLHAAGTVRTPTPAVDPPSAPTTPDGTAEQPSKPTHLAPRPTASAIATASSPSSSPRTLPAERGPSAAPPSGDARAAPTGRAASPASAPATPSTNTPSQALQETEDLGVDLGDQGWVTTEIAAAVATAAALIWIHRRRRYRPRPPGPAHRDDPDLAALPRTVATLHRSRRPAPSEEATSETEPQIRDAAMVTTAALGNQAGKPLRLCELPALGVGLTGPGALAAARGLLTSALSAGGPWAPHAEATIITTAEDLQRILPHHEHLVSDMERLHVADTLGHALEELERRLLRRARIATDISDLATTPTLDDDHTLPPAVFLTTAPSAGPATRLAAILTVGSRLALVGVLLGTWTTGQTWLVHTDGTTTIDGHSGPRLNVLDPTATLEILDTVRQAHAAEDDPSRALPGAPPTRRFDVAPPAVWPGPATPPTHETPPLTDATPPVHTFKAATRRLKVAVLGRPALRVLDGEHVSDLRVRRTDGVQLLVHLAVEPDGATSDELMALLWPEVRPHHSRGRFHTTLSELRHTLAEAVGNDPIARTDDRYHLDPPLVEVDLWALYAAIDKAATAVDASQHATALREAVTLYTGAVAEGHNWLWLAPYREATRRHIVDALAALAADEPNPRPALNLIQEAIRLDPYNEDLYLRAMQLHARLVSPDGVRRTLRTLTERLGELEIQVSPQTEQVASELIERLGIRERTRHGAA